MIIMSFEIFFIFDVIISIRTKMEEKNISNITYLQKKSIEVKENNPFQKRINNLKNGNVSQLTIDGKCLYIESQFFEMLMQSEQKAFQFIEGPPVAQEKPPEPKKDVKSQHVDLYMAKMKKNCTMNMPSLEQIFKGTQVEYSPYFHHKFKLMIRESSINKEVVILQASWGNFTLYIRILNIQSQNIGHGEFISSGKFGDVYKHTLHGQKFIMKCIETREKPKHRARAIKEWFIMKICSILKVGPKLEPYVGFDMLMFSECVEFAMQVCKKMDDQMSVASLYQDMWMMHQAHLLHQDIKTENIMFSPTFNKLVFIDFGLSTFISQDFGLKTLTRYVGSINYWSPQMQACFIRKQQLEVDLYYNDLHCLEATLKVSNEMKLLDESLEDFYEFSSQRITQAIHLNTVLFKYYIYCNQFDQFQYFWNTFKNDYNLLHYESQILSFLEEIPPKSIVRDIFDVFISNVHSQTLIYRRLKILLEVSKKSLFSIKSLQDQQKLTYFSSVCEDYFLDEKDKEEMLQKTNIKNLVFSFQLNNKQTSFLEYIGYYLEYQSYINNKHKVCKADRQKAAQKYWQLNMVSTENSAQMDTNIVAQTINHIFLWLLDNYQQNHRNIYVLLFFRVLDFFFILEIPSQHFIQKCQKILIHPSFSYACRKMFVKRIEAFNRMNQLRIISKDNDVGIFEFECLIQKWTDRKRKQLNGQKDDINSKIPLQLYFEYGSQQFFYVSIQSLIPTLNTFINYYYESIQIFHHVKIYSFLIWFYQQQVFYSNSSLRAQIKQIFTKNIADDQIVSSFRFQYDELFCRPPQIDKPEKYRDTLLEIDKQIEKVQFGNRYTLIESICYISQTVKVLQNITSYTFDFIYQEKYFIYRCYRSYFNMVKIITTLFEFKQYTRAIVTNIRKLLGISKWFSPPRNKEVEEMLLSQLQMYRGTHLYDDIKEKFMICAEVSQLQSLVIRSLTEKNEEESATHRQAFFGQYHKILAISQANPQFAIQNFQALQASLNYGQLMCFSSIQQQNKHHGMHNYFYFCVKYNMVGQYFNTRKRILNVLIRMMHLLWDNNRKQLGRIIFQVCRYLQYYFFSINLRYFQQILLDIFKKGQVQCLWNFYIMLKQDEDKHPDNNFIASVYTIILSFMQTRKQQRTIFASMSKKIDKLHHYYQRHIRIRLFTVFYMNTKAKSERRRRIYYNNILVKLFTNQRYNSNDSFPKISIKTCGIRQKDVMQAKMAKIPRILLSWGTLKYRKLK